MTGDGPAPSASEAAAIAAFEALGVCTALSQAAASLGWTSPSSIQEQAIPHLLAGKQAPEAEN